MRVKETLLVPRSFDLYKLLILDQELLLVVTLLVPRSFDLYKLLILDQELLLVVKTVLEGHRPFKAVHLNDSKWESSTVRNGRSLRVTKSNHTSDLK